MSDEKKYLRARNELYHLVVKFRQFKDDALPARATPELTQVLEIVEGLISEALAAFERGDVMAVQIDCYHPLVLPGLDEVWQEMKNRRTGRDG